jgi:hypothetical protein
LKFLFSAGIQDTQKRALRYRRRALAERTV